MRKLIALIFCAFGFICTYAQYKKPYFDMLNVQNGLPEGNVESSLQDKLGYLWLGTQNGLVRYDGYTTKPYPMPGDDGKPLIAPTIINLFEDDNATVWAGVLNEGIYYLNRQADAFVKAGIAKARGYVLKQDILNQGIEGKRKGTYWLLGKDVKKNIVHLDLYDTINNNVQHFYDGGDKNHLVFFKHSFSLCKDGHCNIWASGDSVFSVYDDKTGLFKSHLTLPGHDTWFNDIYVDKADSNIIWLTTLRSSIADGVQFSNLVKFNTKTYTYSIYANNTTDSLSIAGACGLCYIDALHNVWCVCGNKVSLYNRQKNNFISYAFKLPFSSNPFSIRAVTEDIRHNLWLGGDYAGLFMLQTSTGKINYNIYGENNIKGELPASVAGAAFTDKTGSVWVALQQTGLASLNERRSLFNVTTIQIPVNGNSVRKDVSKFYSFFPDSDSTLLMEVNTGNADPYDIYRWNYTTNNYNKINITAAGSGSPMCIFKDSKGCLWLSCIEQLLYYNPVTNITKTYKTHEADSTIPGIFCYSITEDKYGTVWFGTWRYGIYSYSPQTGKFKHYPFTNDPDKKNTNILFNGQVKSLLFDKDGILWIGTNMGGLTRFDTQTGTFKNIHNQRDGLDCVTTIYQDKKDRLWVGTYRSGLFLVNRATYAYKRYSQQDGLLYDGINSINEDNAGNIWAGTLQRGISVLNPETGGVTNYNAANALPSDDIGDIFRSQKGVLTITMGNGIMNFDPAVLQKNTIPPFVVIESVTYHPANSKNDNNDTELYVYNRTSIPLRYNENKVTFGYTALHYTNPALNKYAYRLDGYDKDWIQAGKPRYVMYLNLLPGSYSFHVKACNSDGVWNEEGASITIIIYPPWWQTWWAYTLYAAIVIAAIWLFVYYRSRKLLQDKKLLEHTVQLRTTEVLEQKEEITAQRDNLEKTLDELKSTQAQLIQSEKMASLGELTAGIAHEIQNPLNFVNNFSEVSNELIDEIQGERRKVEGERDEALQDDLLNDIKLNLEKINHHGKRADSIVKGMLQHSRTGGTVKEATDINKLADEYLRLAYHGFKAKDKAFNINIITSFDESLPVIKVVAQDVGRVLLNIFNNAFYAVQEKKRASPQPLNGDKEYEPTITVSTKHHTPPLGDGGIIIKIKDNGIGIPDAIKEKIMQPFFTTKPTGQGTGLGLSLSYDIVVKAHGGSIEVKSVEGEFTEFTISLPIK